MDSHDPHQRAMELALGHVAARATYAFAYYRLADHLAVEPKSAAMLARATGTHEPSLLRLLRGASALGLVEEHADGTFTLTAVGSALRTDAPRHASAAILAMGGPVLWHTFGEFLESVQTGQSTLSRRGEVPFPPMTSTQAARTNHTMLAFYGDEPAAVARAYDFSGSRTIVDIGGSSGNLLTTVLGANPGAKGVLYDLPHVETEARQMIASRGVVGRCQFSGGSFFESVPAGGDLYILSHVLNDWPEDQCLMILRNVRRAIVPSARLLVIEQLITNLGDSNQAKLLDLIALNVTGGMHRTAAQHEELLRRGGFRLTRIVATTAPVSIIESQPV